MSIRVGDRVVAGSLLVGSDTYTKAEINDLLLSIQTSLDDLPNILLNSIYPVGSIYITTGSLPSRISDLGTWGIS